MIVCVCKRISDRQISQACKEGACSLSCLEKRLGVGSCCGRCKECAQKQLMNELSPVACKEVLATI